MKRWASSYLIPGTLLLIALVLLAQHWWQAALYTRAGNPGKPLSAFGESYRAVWTPPVPTIPNVSSIDGDLVIDGRSDWVLLNSVAEEVDPTWSADGQLLFFASNRGRGANGFDIYWSRREGFGFSPPKALPFPLNSIFNDRSPSVVRLDNEEYLLLFSSNRPDGLATDHDVYWSRGRLEGDWSIPERLPCSTIGGDERSVLLHPDANAFFFTRSAGADAADAGSAVEILETWRLPDGSWAPPVVLAALVDPHNEARMQWRESGRELLFRRAGEWRSTRLQLLRLLPGESNNASAWILLLLALLLLLVRLLASRWKGLELLYRCLLISVLIHLLLWWWLHDEGLNAPDLPAGSGESETWAPVEIDAESFPSEETLTRQGAAGEHVELAARSGESSARVEQVQQQSRSAPQLEVRKDSPQLQEQQRAAALQQRSPQEFAASTPRAQPTDNIPQQMAWQIQDTADTRSPLTESAAAAQLASSSAAASTAPQLRRDSLGNNPPQLSAAEFSGGLTTAQPAARTTSRETAPPGVDNNALVGAIHDLGELAALSEGTAPSAQRSDGGALLPAREGGVASADFTPNRHRSMEGMTTADRGVAPELASAPPSAPALAPAPASSAAAASSPLPRSAVKTVAGGDTELADAQPSRGQPTEPRVDPAAAGARDGGLAAGALAGGTSEVPRAQARRSPQGGPELAAADLPSERQAPQGAVVNRGAVESQEGGAAPSARFAPPAAPRASVAGESATLEGEQLATARSARGRQQERDLGDLAPAIAGAAPLADVVRADLPQSSAGAPGLRVPQAELGRIGLGFPRSGFPRSDSPRVTTPEEFGRTPAISSAARPGGATPSKVAGEAAPAAARPELAAAELARVSPAERGVGALDRADRVHSSSSPRARSAIGPAAGTLSAATAALSPTLPRPALAVPVPTSPGVPRSESSSIRPGNVPPPIARDAVSPRPMAEDGAATRSLSSGQLRGTGIDPVGRSERSLSPLAPRSAEPVSGSATAKPEGSRDQRWSGGAPEAEIPRLERVPGSPAELARGTGSASSEGSSVPWVSARTGPKKAEALRRHGGDAATEAAVANGLQYLASRQRRSGAWGQLGELDEKYGETEVGRSGLALLAFLGAGHSTASDTEYSTHVRLAVQFLQSQQRRGTGHIGRATSSYSHAIATYALGEAFLLDPDPEVKRTLERAVRQILRHQELDNHAPQDFGGWSYYYDDGHRFDRYPRTSVTVWQMMALKTAMLASVEMPEGHLEAGRRFLLRHWSENFDRFLYNRDPRRLQREYSPLPASTPAAAFMLQVLGEDRNSQVMRGAVRMIARRVPRKWATAETVDFIEEGSGNPYFWYYGTLALFLHGGAEWESWNQSLKVTLLPSQLRDGSWEPISVYARYAGDSANDRVYTTALNVLMLEVYYRYLTPFQRSVSGQD